MIKKVFLFLVATVLIAEMSTAEWKKLGKRQEIFLDFLGQEMCVQENCREAEVEAIGKNGKVRIYWKCLDIKGMVVL